MSVSAIVMNLLGVISRLSTLVTFSPALSGSAATLSNGNLSATFSGLGSAISTSMKSAGKWYVEGVYNVVGGISIGFGDSSITGSESTGNTSNSVGLSGGDGGMYLNSVKIGQWCSSCSNGNLVGIAIDIPNKLVWGINISRSEHWNGNVSNDPASGTGGISISGLTSTSPLSICAGTWSGGQTGELTMNFGASAFTGSVPSGFTKWG